MSRSNGSSKSGTAKKKQGGRKNVTRILAIILAIMMFLGVATTLIYYIVTRLAVGTKAADVRTEENVVLNTSSLKDSEDVLVSVGLMWGDNLTTSFQVETENGYSVGIQDLHGDRSFTKIWDIWDPTVAVMSDDNISKTGMTYYISSPGEYVTMGGYHIQVDCDDLSRSEFETLIYSTQTFIWSYGLYEIPAYIYSGYAIRIGEFSSWNDAAEILPYVQDVFPDRIVSVAQPKQTAVSVVNPYTDLIVFEYDCGGKSELGLAAHEDSNGNTYMKTPAGNVYDGVFCFKRAQGGGVDGVSLINVLPLEAYLAGVLPFEISNAWPIEVMKEFAITVRSFTLTHKDKHGYYDFDLCNTTDCQLYKGAGRINDAVMQAVTETKGQVITYEGDIITAYYSSSMGGVTVSPTDAWGGSYEIPYLQAIETPWEDYEGHSNGFWTAEISPSAMYERLLKAGYDELQGPIADVRIAELAKNSTYVKKLEVTDIYGNTVTLVNTDRVRISLSPYLNSANFVVGRGSVEYETRKPYDSLASGTQTLAGTGNSTGTSGKPKNDDYDPYTVDISYGYTDIDSFCVISSAAKEEVYRDSSVNIMTSEGEIVHYRTDVFVISTESAPAFLGAEYIKYVKTGTHEQTEDQPGGTEQQGSEGNGSSNGAPEVIRKTAYAEDSNNFIFVGKGWGHGVGISQYGSYDLAVMGYTAEEILLAYFVGAEIMNYRDTNNFKN